MRADFPPSRIAAAAIALFAGACGRIGYDGDFAREPAALVGSSGSGSNVVATGSGGTFDPQTTTGAGGTLTSGTGGAGTDGPGGGLPAAGGAAGSSDVAGSAGTTDVTGSTAVTTSSTGIGGAGSTGVGGAAGQGGAGILDAAAESTESDGSGGSADAAAAGASGAAGASRAGGAATSGSSSGGAAGAGQGGASGSGGGSGSGGAVIAGVDASVDAGADASKDAGPAGTCDYASDLILLYRRYAGTNGQIAFGLKVGNQSNRPIDLQDIKIRYYFTSELASPSASIQYGDVCCPDVNILGHVTATVASMSPAVANADTYVEIGFNASTGNLAANHAVEVEINVDGVGSGIFNQANDYSYTATATSTQSQWDNCPGSGLCTTFRSCVVNVLLGDVLVWGYRP